MSTYPYKYYLSAQATYGRMMAFFVTTNQPIDSKEAFEALHKSLHATGDNARQAVVANLVLVSPGYSQGDFAVLTIEPVA